MSWDIYIEAVMLPGMGSDHWPVKVEMDIKAKPKRKPFRFEAFWLRDKNFIKKVEKWWKQSSKRGRNKMETFQMKLKELKRHIRKWNEEEFGNILKDQKMLEQKMKQIQQEIINTGRSEKLAKEEGILIGQLEERRKQEEILWRKKSRVNWLREGEQNTKFFHQEMVQRRHRNRIFSIKNESGTRVTQHEDIEQVLSEHFKEILTEPNVDRRAAIEEICKEIPSRITREQNLALMRAATLEEV